jgi:hypothetical protein
LFLKEWEKVTYDLKRGWLDRLRCWIAKLFVPKEVKGWIDTGFTFLVSRMQETELREHLRKHPPTVYDLKLKEEE